MTGCDDFERIWNIDELTKDLYIPFDNRKGANSRDYHRDK